LVRESKKTELEQAIISSIEEFYGKNQEESNSYGRIINTRRIRALKSYLNKGNIVYGGKMDEESRYFAPTLIDHIDLESSIMKDEIFGPILPIISYTNESEIFEIVKRNRNPLALYLFTTRKRFENEIITKIPFGGGTINATLVHLVNTKTPFGGIGASGWGSYHGKAGFDAFTHYKSIAKMGSWVDVKLKYPPYNSLKNKLIRLFLK
jgi:aldehyde dehydrogenase (NAD+)